MNGLVPLAEARDERLFGGKSASLSRAIRTGLPVPPGFALSVDAVDAVVQADGGVIRSLEDTIASLGGPVAVRSSAVGEDSQDASFAGQHATLLNVRTHTALIDAIGEVYQSAHSGQAWEAVPRRFGSSRTASTPWRSTIPSSGHYTS